MRIYEWQDSVLHAKTSLIDDRWVRVGSSNLNVSSLFGNYELDVLVDDAVLAGAMAEQYRRDVSQSVEIVLKVRRRLPPRVRPDIALPRGRTKRPRRTRRAVQTVKQVAAGARRSLAGAAVFTMIGVSVLMFTEPGVLGWVLGLGVLLVAAGALWEGIIRKRGTYL